ncbi:GNAT family N-acetyltransferase [Arthrobacter roseus]|uniref:GNAT family N-acetyltransferase n=1 Tax=Arthrobacter roseus TaxID=136274 RepID=UPI001963BD00|nr:RimJ/RimL family protein N-acetyltransferase [Arthrobacter roseus]
MKSLKTERLVLRPWERSDAEFVYDMYSRWDVQRYIGQIPRLMQDTDEARTRIERWRTSFDGVHGIWAAQRVEDSRLVGTILLKSIPSSGIEPLEPSGDTEVGWHFHPDFWGQGYASEGAAAALNSGFEAGLERIVAVTNPENLLSQRVCSRLGMKAQGLTDQYYNSTCELFVANRPPELG